MPRPRLLFAIFSLALLTAHCAYAQAAGLNLSWDDCGSFGTNNRLFACNTNSGTETLVGSVVAPAGITELTTMEIYATVVSTPVLLPNWWQFKNAGTCRQNSASVSFDFTGGPFNCGDYWSTNASGGIAAYQIGIGTPNNARLIMAAAVPSANYGPLTPDVEYYAFKFRINHMKTVGTGACTGCNDEVLITLNEIKLVQPNGVGNYRITTPATRNYATWQLHVVPTQGRTWGAIKSLYR